MSDWKSDINYPTRETINRLEGKIAELTTQLELAERTLEYWEQAAQLEAPNVPTEADRLRLELAEAKAELEQAKRELALADGNTKQWFREYAQRMHRRAQAAESALERERKTFADELGFAKHCAKHAEGDAKRQREAAKAWKARAQRLAGIVAHLDECHPDELTDERLDWIEQALLEGDEWPP